MEAPEGMREVSQSEFYAHIGPMAVHPSVAYSPDYTVWHTPSFVEVGRTFPGWKKPGDPKHYFLRLSESIR